MLGFLRGIAELDDLYEIIVKMIDFVEMIRADKIGYKELYCIGSNITLDIGNALSKKFAHTMSGDFLCTYQNNLNWSIIACRRYLELNVLASLHNRNYYAYISKVSLRHYPMDNADLLGIIKSLLYWIPDIGQQKLVEMMERSMSESEIDKLLDIMESIWSRDNPADYQILSSSQRKRLESIRCRHNMFIV
jgi:hypothetical protein